MASSLLALAKSIYYIYISTDRGVGGGGGGVVGRRLQGNWWFSPPASMTSPLALTSVTFKMASRVHRRDG